MLEGFDSVSNLSPVEPRLKRTVQGSPYPDNQPIREVMRRGQEIAERPGALGPGTGRNFLMPNQRVVEFTAGGEGGFLSLQDAKETSVSSCRFGKTPNAARLRRGLQCSESNRQLGCFVEFAALLHLLKKDECCRVGRTPDELVEV